MKKIFPTIVSFFIFVTPVFAIADPLGVPNNRVGVHILETSEIGDAAKLVNSHGGDWGYVTIPMRSNDRDADKWRKFFINAGQLHIIPIIRLATYPVDNIWETPTVYDLVDFANFLADMPWPTTNRYVVLFNEPNHASEWGGQVNPFDYARLLVDAHQIFKTRSQDFFLLSAGLDMSAPNSDSSEDALRFYQEMTRVQPDWYQSIDGLAVHAYPNPGFSASVFAASRYGITSFRYEQTTLAKFGLGPKPIFITETGSVSQNDFFTPAFTQVWTDPNIVAITPFLLYASSQFQDFSLLTAQHLPKKSYSDIVGLTKISGSPLLSTLTLSEKTSGFSTSDQPGESDFLQNINSWIANMFKSEPKSSVLKINDLNMPVEVEDTIIKQAQGLSGRKSLNTNAGMLFKFNNPSYYKFWMKDMNFGLDLVWISKNKIVEISENVPPPSQSNNQPVIITPQEPVEWVLEVNAGFVKAHNIAVGDSVFLNN